MAGNPNDLSQANNYNRNIKFHAAQLIFFLSLNTKWVKK